MRERARQSSAGQQRYGSSVAAVVLVVGYVAVFVAPVVLAALIAGTGHSLVWELGKS